jgi:hypothetical protein
LKTRTLYHYKHYYLIILFFAFIAAAIIGPIASEQNIPDMADYANHLAGIIQAKMAFMEGQFPLRITPLEQSGWRYPFYQFYSPTTYTFAGLIYWLITPANPLTACKITIWLALVAAGLFMYRLAYWFVQSKPAALLASVVYLFSPYYIIVVNRLGNLSETLALAMVPAVIYYSLQRYYFPEKEKTLLQTSLVWYLLATIHLVTFVYTSLMVGIFFVLLTVQTRNHYKNLFKLGIAYIFAAMLSAWFLGPINLLGKYFFLGDTYKDASNLIYFHPLISYLISPVASITSGASGGIFKVHPGVGWPVLLAVGVCFYARFYKQSIGYKRADYFLPSLLILFSIAFFMVWSPFNFWQWLPSSLLIAQYSWRLLDQVIWIGAILFAWAFLWLYKNKVDLSHVLLGIFLIALSASPWIPEIKSSPVQLSDFIKKPVLVYNTTAYALNFIKNTAFVTNIDSLVLDPSELLPLNTPIHVHHALLKIADKPAVSVQGTIPDDAGSNSILSAKLNNNVISTLKLKPGKFNWNFPLPAVSTLPQNEAAADLQFEITPALPEKTPATAMKISLDKILLSGFVKTQEIMTLPQIESLCRQSQTHTLCNIAVTPTTKILELPILFYPGLLKITLNGKNISYQGIAYQGSLIAGIIPLAGQINHVSIQFTGLPWANYVSWLAWSLWLIVLMHIAFKRYFSRSLASGDPVS